MELLGRTLLPCCNPHLRSTCAAVLPSFLAISFTVSSYKNRETVTALNVAVQLLKITVLKVHHVQLCFLAWLIADGSTWIQETWCVLASLQRMIPAGKVYNGLGPAAQHTPWQLRLQFKSSVDIEVP